MEAFFMKPKASQKFNSLKVSALKSWMLFHRSDAEDSPLQHHPAIHHFLHEFPQQCLQEHAMPPVFCIQGMSRVNIMSVTNF